MTTHLKILNDTEIKAFKAPPLFNGADRVKFFTQPQQWLKEEIANFKTDSNKIGFVLVYGYFKAEKQFYSPQTFRDRDMAFVAKHFNIDLKNSGAQDYDRATLKRHRDIVIEKLGFSYFDEAKETLLIKETEELVSRQLKPKIIFFSLLDFLKRNRIEIGVICPAPRKVPQG